MFERVFVETEVKNNPIASNLMARFEKSAQEVVEIDRVEKYFNRKKKPYLQKRTNLNLFLGKKRGTLLKEAPDAYGVNNGPHYYFINAYNCPYECQYCYLQGHFNSPDIVLFVNYEDMCQEMKRVLETHADEQVWFHAGEFSDSLVWSHFTGEIEYYHKFCEKNPKAFIELRTKSNNIRGLKELKPLPNLITSFSLSPERASKEIDLKTPSLSHRLGAVSELVRLGHPVGIHFDPIVISNNYENEYKDLIQSLRLAMSDEIPEYLSLGVMRFTKDIYYQMQKNYPETPILGEELIKSFDGKMRYPRPIRQKAMRKIKSMLVEAGIPKEVIYLCMED